MNNTFDYGPFLITKLDNEYSVSDMNYNTKIGTVKVVEGPGAIIELDTTFLDASQAYAISKFLQTLNKKGSIS